MRRTAVITATVLWLTMASGCSGDDDPGQAPAQGVDGAPGGGAGEPGTVAPAPGSTGTPGATPGATPAPGTDPGPAPAPGKAPGPGPGGMDAGTGPGDDGPAPGGQDAGTADAGGDPDGPDGPVLPPVDDPSSPGPFDVQRIDRVDGLGTHSLFVPDDVGTHGKHPVVIWTNGNGGSLGTLSYASFVEHVASHGFLVIADKASNGTREAEVDSQGAAIDWAIAENQRQGGMFFERIDTERFAVMGHSLGSLASFATASDERVRTSIHFSGGITDNPVGFDPNWLQMMRRPAAFLCGGADNTAGPSCAKDFEMAPVPVFYGVLAGASHIGPFVSPRGGEYGRAGVAWLRWQLADDDSFRPWFVGSDCVLCERPWSAMSRDLE